MKIRTSIELAAILDDDKCGERRVHAFLKRNLDIVVGTFATSWNYAKAYSEIEFGSDYRADFLVLCADSGSWTAHVIELKSPTDRLYTTKGVKTSKFLLVERQLAQRSDWKRAFDSHFREALAKKVPLSVAAQCSDADSHSSAHSELRDPLTNIWFEPHAVIGRSSKLTHSDRERRRQDESYRLRGSGEILTFDRFLQVARRAEGD